MLVYDCEAAGNRPGISVPGLLSVDARAPVCRQKSIELFSCDPFQRLHIFEILRPSAHAFHFDKVFNVEDVDRPFHRLKKLPSYSFKVKSNDDIDQLGNIFGVVEIPGDQIPVIDVLVAELENIISGNG